MEKRFFFFIIIFLVLLYAPLVFWPEYQSFKALDQEVNFIKNEIAKKEEYLQQLRGLKEEIEQHSQELKKVSAALPDNAELGPLLYSIRKKASESGLFLKKTTIFTEEQGIKKKENIKNKKEEKTREHLLEVELEGNYAGLLSFLQSLEKSARLIQVLKVEINKIKMKEETSSSNFIQIKIKIKTNSWLSPASL